VPVPCRVAAAVRHWHADIRQPSHLVSCDRASAPSLIKAPINGADSTAVRGSRAVTSAVVAAPAAVLAAGSAAMRAGAVRCFAAVRATHREMWTSTAVEGVRGRGAMKTGSGVEISSSRAGRRSGMDHRPMELCCAVEARSTSVRGCHPEMLSAPCSCKSGSAKASSSAETGRRHGVSGARARRRRQGRNPCRVKARARGQIRIKATPPRWAGSCTQILPEKAGWPPEANA
jgi:hypothetical protein